MIYYDLYHPKVALYQAELTPDSSVPQPVNARAATAKMSLMDFKAIVNRFIRQQVNCTRYPIKTSEWQPPGRQLVLPKY